MGDEVQNQEPIEHFPAAHDSQPFNLRHHKEHAESNPNPNKPKRKISLSLPAILISLFILIVTIGAIGAIFYNKQSAAKIAAINDFESCAAAGNPIMESYPEQCSVNGQTFTRVLAEEEQKKLDPTADWQTYNSVDGSYSVKYDPTKFVRNYCDDFDAGFILESRTGDEIDPSIWRFCGGSSYFPPVFIRTIDREITYKPISNPNRTIEVKNITVDGVPMTRADITVFTAEGPGDISQTILQGKYNGKVYELSARKEFATDFDQILSTFKFTDQVTASCIKPSTIPQENANIDTSSWKTYASTVEQGLSFKYPSDWKASSNIIKDGVHGEAQGPIESFALTSPSGFVFRYSSYPSYPDGGNECLVSYSEKVSVPNFKDLYLIENDKNEIFLRDRNASVGQIACAVPGNGMDTKTSPDTRDMEFIGVFESGEKKKYCTEDFSKLPEALTIREILRSVKYSE